MNSIVKSLGSDAWIIGLSNQNLIKLLNHFEEVEIQSSTNSIKLSRTVQCPEFLNIDQHISAPEAGISFSTEDIKEIYLTVGIKNHRDLSLNIALQSELVTFSFNITPKVTALISELTQHVTEVSDAPEQCQQEHPSSCPCCQAEKKKIQANPNIHPLYWLLKHFEESQNTLHISHYGKCSTSNLTLCADSATTHQGTVHLRSYAQHTSIHLTEVYNVRVHLEVSGGVSFTTLTAFNSFGEKTFKLRQDCAKCFQVWNSILQSHHKRAAVQ